MYRFDSSGDMGARPGPYGSPVDRMNNHATGLPVLRLSSSSIHVITTTPAEPQVAFRSFHL
jgi:hypothetical protein